MRLRFDHDVEYGSSGVQEGQYRETKSSQVYHDTDAYTTKRGSTLYSLAA